MPSQIKKEQKNYVKIGIIAGAVIVVAALGLWGISAIRGSASIESAVSGVSSDAVSGADLHIAIIRMDEIQNKADVLSSLRTQKESFESKLRDELTRTQKTLEKEKAEIEKSQDLLSREALARRVQEYQQKVGKLQRDVTERAQAIEAEYQKALTKVQKNDLDPIIEAIIAKKNLSLVMDGRFARISSAAPAALDITNDVISAMNKRVSSMRMGTPKKF
ncbi:MAG: OmpH family outer membrane protein [Rickettsiales bacterium]|jgi:Skp family chaperone for outer membrane proteins|nr:OmpH family outer membrane protein [Rickettsiales bacterium]